MTGTILLMDNVEDALNKWGSLLEEVGYDVVKASTLEKAENALKNESIHLAILDIRMVDEDDENDISGLILAQNPEFVSTPKIVLTAQPSFEYARLVLTPNTDGQRSALNFIAKAEGPRKLIVAIERAFASVVRINWDLIITFRRAGLFNEMVLCVLEKELSKNELDTKTDELEELFRRLFYDYDQVDLDIVEKRRDGKAAVWAYMRRGDKIMPPRLVKFGRLEDILAEKRSYDDTGELVGRWMVRRENVETSIHFGVIEYSAVGFDLEQAKWLVDCFQWLDAMEVNQILDDLFEEKISKCLYEQPCPAESNKSLAMVYQESLGLSEGKQLNKDFQQAVQETLNYMQIHYMVSVKANAKKHRLTLIFPNGQELSCPNPLTYAYKLASSFGPPVLRRISLGGIDGFNILVDQDKKAWLTECQSIGPAPNLSDFVALEAKIRFEWVDTTNVDWNQIYEFETAFSPPAIKSLENSVQDKQLGVRDLDKSLIVIAHLRKLAAKSFGNDIQEYQLGLLFQVIGILVKSNLPAASKARALLAAVIISHSLEQLH